MTCRRCLRKPRRGRCSVDRWSLWTIFLGALLVGPVLADDREASSIVEFVDAKDRWDRSVGQPMNLEGRYTVFSSTELRFRNCDMRFVLTRSFRRPRGSKRNVEVAGQIVRQDGKLVFRVSELKPRETDREMLIRKRSLINNSRPEGAYELAAWALRRGDFYDDDELRSLSKDLYEEGLTIGYQHLKPGDVVGLRDLAKRAGEYNAGSGLRLQYLHEANRLEWQSEQEAPQPNFRRVLGLIRRDLPGAMTPLKRRQLSIRKEYEQAPKAYRLASAENRQLLDRAFYLEVALANITLDAAEDGRNGYKIAGRIERDLPELTGLADTYREQELRYLSARLAQLSRPQVVDLSRRYQDRDKSEQAKDVIRRWLNLRKSQAVQNGPTELMELGDEFVNLLSDDLAAAQLYKLAYQKNPQSKTAADWLRRHDYVLRGTGWSKPGETDENPEKAMITEAIQEGRVLIGMTAEQVRKALLAKPSSVVRMASTDHVDELWTFQDHGITVRLKRRSKASTSIVVAISTIE